MFSPAIRGLEAIGIPENAMVTATIALLITAIATAGGIMATGISTGASVAVMAARPVGHTVIKCNRYTNG